MRVRFVRGGRREGAVRPLCTGAAGRELILRRAGPLPQTEESRMPRHRRLTQTPARIPAGRHRLALSARRRSLRSTRVPRAKTNRPISLVPPLPYKVDTSRPSLRTNWTRLVPFPRAARGSARALRPQDPRGFHRSLEPFDVSSAPPRWPGRGVRLVCTERWRDVRPVCMGGGEMCVRSVRGEGLASVSRGQCFDDAWISGSGACDPASERTPSFSARAAAGTDTCGAGGKQASRQHFIGEVNTPSVKCQAVGPARGETVCEAGPARLTRAPIRGSVVNC